MEPAVVQRWHREYTESRHEPTVTCRQTLADRHADGQTDSQFTCRHTSALFVSGRPDDHRKWPMLTQCVCHRRFALQEAHTLSAVAASRTESMFLCDSFTVGQIEKGPALIPDVNLAPVTCYRWPLLKQLSPLCCDTPLLLDLTSRRVNNNFWSHHNRPVADTAMYSDFLFDLTNKF